MDLNFGYGMFFHLTIVDSKDNLNKNTQHSSIFNNKSHTELYRTHDLTGFCD